MRFYTLNGKHTLSNGFTLIEIIIVIIIISILAVAIIPRLTAVQGKARDTKRIADLKQIQAALELYYNENGAYPSTSMLWKGGSNCPQYYNNSNGNYISGLVPNYLSELPLDPKPKEPHGCYLYMSDGKDYKMLAYKTVEGKIPEEFNRKYVNPLNNLDTFAIYSPGAISR